MKKFYNKELKSAGFRIKSGMTGSEEQGRSMVEMLGVLAVIGVLSVAGVGGYMAAMKRHRANELLNEANKRAVVLAMKIAAGGVLSDTASDGLISEFDNPAGYAFNVLKNPNNAQQFKMEVSGVSQEVCEQMLAMMAGTVRGIECPSGDSGTATLTFNNDLSDTVFASDFETETACTEAGHDWCGTTASGVCAPTETDCCTVLNYNNACQTCTNGVVKDDFNLVCQNCNGTYNNGVNCTTANNAAGICENGQCLPTNVSENQYCITQAECGGVGSGYFCHYSSYSNYCTEDPATAMGCAGETLVENCPSTAQKGQCKKVSTYFEKGAKIEGLGYLTKSKVVDYKGLNWWTAVNFCSAQGKTLFNLHNPTENKLQCFNVALGTGSTKGKCCNSADSCSSTELSTPIQSFRTNFGENSQALWMQNAYGNSSCNAFNVYLSGSVSNDYRYTTYYSALCE